MSGKVTAKSDFELAENGSNDQLIKALKYIILLLESIDSKP